MRNEDSMRTETTEPLGGKTNLVPQQQKKTRKGTVHMGAHGVN